MSQSIKLLTDNRIEIWDENYRGGGIPLIICFDKFPLLPFRCIEEYTTKTLDVFVYIIDANNTCWSNTFSGGWLYPITSDFLLEDMDKIEDQRKLRKFLGLSDIIPEWVNIAKKYGWKPPLFWRDEDALNPPRS